VTVTPSKVKVKVTEHLNFDSYRNRACWRRWPQPPCGAFWF